MQNILGIITKGIQAEVKYINSIYDEGKISLDVLLKYKTNLNDIMKKEKILGMGIQYSNTSDAIILYDKPF